MFQFRRFPSHTYLIQYGIPCGGFPHSEISGSRLICSSPKLIAAYHVLHRLLMPRHSPCALCNLTFRRCALSKFRKSPWAFGSGWFTPLLIGISSQIQTRFAGLWIRKENDFKVFASLTFNTSQPIDSPIGSLYSWIMQAHVLEVSFCKNCIFTLSVLKLKLRKNFLYCCLLIIAS